MKRTEFRGKGIRKWKIVLAVTGVMAAVALSSGCQMNKYEKIELSEISEEDGKEEGRKAKEAESQKGVSGDSGQSAHEAASSPVKAEITRETAPEMEARDEVVFVDATDLNVRSFPGAQGAVVGTLNRGEQLKRTGYSQSWSRVDYQGRECYVSSQYLTTSQPKPQETETDVSASQGASAAQAGEIGLNPDWKYADFSKIHSGKAVLYKADGANRKGKVVCVNAGHGTSGGSSVKTLCHPDGTPKVTGGSTAAGATTAIAVSSGMTFSDGTPEAKVTLALAMVVKKKLLARGFDVLMIRESDDVQLDNIARTVIANNVADCHIAIHYDSTTNDKGAFYMSVPNIASYRAMEPVASYWQQHHALGDSLIAGLRGVGAKIYSGGKIDMDLTQTSYSMVPSVDIELGDKGSDHSAASLDKLGNGLADGVELFFKN